jgi:FMN phosphatase YigB (HAD superfamily)
MSKLLLEAVLFDLDNTLYLYDEPSFYEHYFEKIIPFFADLVPADEFKDRLHRSLLALMQNDGRVPNSLCFLDTFCYRYRSRLPSIWQRFIAFYESEYDSIPVQGQPPEGLYKVVDHLHQRGLRMVVASNPIFPLIVQEKRLGWTGLDRDQFEFITHMENMAWAKPSKGYFLQICEELGLTPERCVMVGNDPVNDMAAGDIGMHTYLTTDAVDSNFRWATINHCPNEPLSQPDHRGPLAGLSIALDKYMM